MTEESEIFKFIVVIIIIIKYPPWECDSNHSLLCCIAFAREHGETAKNLADTVGH